MPKNFRDALWLSVILLPSLVKFSPVVNARPWVAFGDIRGHFESCGCDPKTDLGGMSRLGYFLDKKRREHPGLLVLNTGRNFGEKNDIKDRSIEKGVLLLKPTATLALAQKRQTGGGEASNEVLTYPHIASVPKFILEKQTIIMGVRLSDLHGAKIFIRDIAPKIFERHSTLVDEKILLFGGSLSLLRFMKDSGLFDLIISSNSSEAEDPISAAERERPGQLNPFLNTFIVPLGGVGVVVGGGAEQKISLLTEEVKGSPMFEKSSLKKLESKLFQQSPIVWLDSSIDGQSRLSPLIKSYEEQMNLQFDLKAKSMKGREGRLRYAGSASCKTCHLKSWSAWAKSSHAHAYETLKKKNRHKNESCVGCHSVGYNQGGFIAQSVTPHLAGVQCENCHGPRIDHVTNPSVKQTYPNPKKICKSCHHSPHSSSFDFNERWKDIKHGL